MSATEDIVHGNALYLLPLHRQLLDDVESFASDSRCMILPIVLPGDISQLLVLLMLDGTDLFFLPLLLLSSLGSASFAPRDLILLPHLHCSLICQ